jgi:hypothetical protein
MAHASGKPIEDELSGFRVWDSAEHHSDCPLSSFYFTINYVKRKNENTEESKN